MDYNAISLTEQHGAQKKKRSFMLTDEQINKIYLLKASEHEKDLSTIVGEAVELYFEKYNKK